MTNKEAIKILKNYHNGYFGYKIDEVHEAHDLAIKVLEDRQEGKWEFDSEYTEFGNPYGTYKCDKCGGHSSNKYPFCFWCGADMRKEKISD